MWANENRARYDHSKLRYPSDVTDAEWAFVEPLISPARRGGGKRTIEMRAVRERLDVCALDRLPVARDPERFAAQEHGLGYFDLWTYDGTLDRIHHALYVKCREAAGREASLTATIIDSQSVKSAEKEGIASIRTAAMQERMSNCFQLLL